jgi:hypothetical protein
MPEAESSPAWASTALGDTLLGPWQDATVFADTPVAAYAAVTGQETPGQVIALLRLSAIRLPVGFCVADERLPATGTSVRIGHGMVSVPGHTWRPVRWWDPRPHISPQALLRHGQELVDIVFDEPASAFGGPVTEALSVAAALAGGDTRPALDVIGLGPGLTPAGDDVVAGALAVLALVGRLDDSARDAINQHALTNTAALSAALLVAAGRGQMIPQAARLLTSLSAGEPAAQVHRAAHGLFRVGSTSGHDLCAGMAGALAGLR